MPGHKLAVLKTAIVTMIKRCAKNVHAARFLCAAVFVCGLFIALCCACAGSSAERGSTAAMQRVRQAEADARMENQGAAGSLGTFENGVKSLESAQNERQETVKSREPVTLEFYSWHDESAYMTKAVAAFMEQYPWIQVNPHFVPSSVYAQTIAIRHNTDGEGIDIFMESSPYAAINDVKRGYAAKLELLQEELAELPDSYREMLDLLEVDGESYMLPYRKSTWAVYYNRDLFDQFGVPYPEGSWTWTEYTELARQMTGYTSAGERVYGSISYEYGSSWWRTPARMAGAENRMTYSSLACFKDAARWAYQLAYEYQAAPKFTELTDVGSQDYAGSFLDGHIAMMYCGDWAMELIQRAAGTGEYSLRYDIAPLPGPDSGEAYMPVTLSVGMVSSRSAHPEEALLFARWLSGPEGAELLAQDGIIPALETAEVRRALEEQSSAPEHIECFLEYENPVYTLPEEGTMEALEVLQANVGKYLLQELSLDQAFEQAQREMEVRGLIEEN